MTSVETRASTGNAGLDDVLGGGLPPGHMYLLEGDPGSGKTTLALQFLLDGARRGEPALYVTLSETEAELRGVADSHGWSLDGITIFELAGRDATAGEDQYSLFHPAEVELGETTKAILDVVDRVGPRRVVFDSLSEMRLLAREPLRYRRQVLSLKQYFLGRDSTVVLVDDRTSEPGDLQLQSLAHGVITLEQLSPEYGRERRRLRVLKMRGVQFRGGFHDFEIRRGGLAVFPRLVAAEHHARFEPKRLGTGVAELDALLAGGLDLGTSALLMGPAGSGKSSLATLFAKSAADRGDVAAIFSFDEGVNVLLARARGLGLDLEPHVASGRLLVRQVDSAELTPGELTSIVRAACEKDGAKVVVIDSLNGYLSAMPEEGFLIAHMHELLAYLAHLGVATILVMAQQGVVGAMRQPVDVSYLADTVLLLRYFEAFGEIRKAISVVKRRAGGHERTIRELLLTPEGIRIGAPLADFHGVLTGVPVFHGKVAELFGGPGPQPQADAAPP